ncbi:hypothetical protein [Isoptericola sp. NPDC019482]|uniref:hypothetical protein n=1 Tax=Isoptericola sp. NPDC019482 TaxID=3154688 RepID=UPI00347D3727
MRRTRTAGVALLALAVAGSAAACADDDAGAATLARLQASASASPSLSDEEQEKQRVVEEAEEFLAEFQQAEVDAGNDGFTGWPTLANEYWSSALAEGFVPVYQEAAAKGQYTTGASELESSEVTDYVAEEPGHEQVAFTSCLDTSSLHLHQKDGSEIPLPNERERSVVVHRLVHQGEGNSWRVTESTPQDGSC